MLRTTGQKISSPGAVLAILCFFLPWILVSCNDRPVASVSGWQLAAGGTIQTSLGAETIPGNFWIFLVLLASLAVIAFLFFTREQEYGYKRDSYTLVTLGILPLGILLLSFWGAKDRVAETGFTLRFQYGLWGVIIGNILVIAGGIVDMLLGPEVEPQQPLHLALRISVDKSRQNFERTKAEGIAVLGGIVFLISIFLPWVGYCIEPSSTCDYTLASGFSLITAGFWSILVAYGIAIIAFFIAMYEPENTLYCLVGLCVSLVLIGFIDVMYADLIRRDFKMWGMFLAIFSMMALYMGLFMRLESIMINKPPQQD